jgi:hypothetical protein
MFIIGGNQGVCPKGFICLNNYNLLIVLAIIIGFIYFINKQNYLSLYTRMLDKKSSTDDIQLLPEILYQSGDSHPSSNDHHHHQPFNNPSNNHQETDVDRMLLNDRLYPPLSRNYHQDTTGNVESSRKGLPINIETRGSGGDFQQVGILSKNVINKDAETPGNNTDSNILPLYGKPTYRGSNKWLYYTETDKLNPVKIPITVNNRDCTDDIGCDELYDGGEVVIPSYNGVFKVKIYKFNKPRYIPFV